ncbi:MAG: phosphoenolpyruvate carboxylase [Gammaproteobacteria bacterium]|nr:phosphoenolpyruvate carboxylase [Gammaproteobacteria bacterium]
MPLLSQKTDNQAPLRNDIRLMGRLLGETICEQAGDDVYTLVERIRLLSKDAATGDEQSISDLQNLLTGLSDPQLIPVVRSFGHLLNLMNIAEQYHRVRRLHEVNKAIGAEPQSRTLGHLITQLLDQGVSKRAIISGFEGCRIELVLTAHPTEVTRRTISHKHDQIVSLLALRDRADMTEYGATLFEEQLRAEIASVWGTDEIRHQKPTPIEEAKWGFATVEQTLWQAVPDYLRYMDFNLRKYLGEGLDIEATPIRFASWMGGDRDGNPNVTAATTNHVCWLSRWQAAELLYKDINALRNELSMSVCSNEIRALVGDHPEPYRALLRSVRDRLARTREYLSARLEGQQLDEGDIYVDASDLSETLMACYRSLKEQGMTRIANGTLTDIIRRVNSFGLHLLPLDLRQESSRHSEVLDAVTRYVGLGSYLDWGEQQRIDFLVKELAGHRPLVPFEFFEGTVSQRCIEEQEGQTEYAMESVYEVLATFKAICQHPRSSFANYIISMAHGASDILAVMLLQREAGVTDPLPVMPLFETLDDLNQAGPVIDSLLQIDDYIAKTGAKQGVMIGYSDSAKDAGFLAASWAQYRAQEQLVEICQRHQVDLQLFHGRGGSMSRGGGSAHDALLSQPPGAVAGHVRITEQGEMIRFKFGISGIAQRTLELYTCATIEATLAPPPAPKKQWRDEMDRLTENALNSYRNTIQDKDFLEYFHTATPEKELQRLLLGSRPAKRNAQGGIDSLRAIPWVFAWTQTRLLVPAWLGTEYALEASIKAGQLGVIREMKSSWPYFSSIIDMLEMVLAKSLPLVSEYYEHCLMPEGKSDTGQQLRERLAQAISAVLALRGADELLQQSSVIQRSISVRNPYVMPLHYLQAEIMCRLRKKETSDSDERGVYEQALKISIASIAAGMRNTG